MQDFLDIVATQGAYLAPRAGTPVFQEAYDDQFAAALERRLHSVITEQIWRRAMYHGAADKWPMGHTPPGVKEKCKAELKALEELEGFTSEDGGDDEDDEDDNNNDKNKGGNDIDTRVGPGQTVAALDRPRRLHQAGRLPTLLVSTKSPLATPYRRKRQRISKEDEDESPAKKHANSAKEVSTAPKEAVPST